MASEVTSETARKMVRRDVNELAPKMREAVLHAVSECEVAGYPVQIYECLRTHELARIYFALGASKARDGFKTWHFYGLAVDVIHPVYGWTWWEDGGAQGRAWREFVVSTFKKHGLDWGGEWISFKDRPHFQFGTCKPSPSKEAIRLYEEAGGGEAGRRAVWEAVGAA